MVVLGIETSSPRGSVALVEDGAVLLELSHEVPNAHAEQLIVLVDQLFSDTGVPREAVSRVAVGVGPGSFTGLRVGIALAQGLALGLAVPLFGIPSLRALAHAALPHRPKGSLLCPVLDARRGEAFVAAFDEGLQELLPVQTLPAISLTEELQALLANHAHVLCGDFAHELAPNQGLKNPDLIQFPSASSCAKLALSLSDDTPAEVVPLYVRPPDAILPKLPPNPLLPA